MPAVMTDDTGVQFVPVGTNTARPFGMDARDRSCRLASNAGLDCREVAEPGRAALLASMGYAWDPAWLKAMRARPRAMLTLGGEPVMAHVPAGEDAAAVAAALERGSVVDGYEILAAETTELSYAELRKRERPFVLPLDPEDPEPVERAAYDAAYKGVTDVLTLYLWRKPAFYLTRWAARPGLTPNIVTLVGAILCVLAFFLFWRGDYWLGVLSGFVFMVLDTVDGKLARCTGASSKWGNLFDHGIDLIHPPFWWWAWEHGLAAYGRAAHADLCDHGAVGDHRRLCRAARDRGHFHAPLRGHAHPRVEADRQPLPADHRAAQSEHGDPGRRVDLRTAGYGAGAGRVVDADQPHLPCRAARPGKRAGGARTPDRLLARVSRWTAFLLAGSRPGGDPLARSMMIGHKALIPVAGEPMVLRPLRALLASPEVGDIIVLTQDPGDLQPILPDDARVRIRASRGTIAQTLAEQLPTMRRNSRCWSRPPTTRCSTRRWLPSSPPGRRAPTLPIAVVESRPLLARFPHTKRTWIGFRGGRYSGANLFALRLAKVLPAVSRGGAVEQDRKKGWRLLSALGPRIAARRGVQAAHDP